MDHPDWTFAQIAKWISDEWKKVGLECYCHCTEITSNYNPTYSSNGLGVLCPKHKLDSIQQFLGKNGGVKPA